MDSRKDLKIVMVFLLKRKITKMTKIVIDETKDLWFVSDTNFNHQKLVRSCPDHFDQIRNYETTEEMNEDIMTQWNKFVGPEDTVIFLGDFGFNIKSNEIANLFYEKMGHLNGNKIFIKLTHLFIEYISYFL